MLLTSAAQGAGVPVGKGDTVGTQGQAQVESLSLEHVQAQSVPALYTGMQMG